MQTTPTSRPAPGHTPLGGITAPYPVRARALAVARNFDLVLVPVGVTLALVLGAPVFGVLVGAGGWLLQRALAAVNRRLIDRAAEPGSQLGLNFVDAFARIWLLAGAIVVAGAAGHRADGLAAALLIFAAYSLAFAMRVASGRPGGGER
jgi:hypothetical protein